MAYTVLVAVPFSAWSQQDNAFLKKKLNKYGMGSYILTGSNPPHKNDLAVIIDKSDLVLVIYSSEAFNSELISEVIGEATKQRKHTIIIKELGVPLRGRVTGVDIIDYDANRPEQAISTLITLASRIKVNQEKNSGATIAKWAIGLGLAAGLVYLLYKLMTDR